MKGYRVKKVDREKPFLACWRVDGKEKTKAFSNKQDAQTFLNNLKLEKAEYGIRAININFSEYEKYLQFIDELNGAQMDDVIRVWKTYGKPPEIVKLGDAVSEYLLKVDVSLSCLAQYRTNLQRLVQYFKYDSPLDSITIQDMNDWLSLLKKDFSPITIHHHKRNAKTFFNWCMKAPRKYLNNNPAEHTADIKIDIERVEILSPEETAQLLHANKEKPIIGRLALETFAGLRASSAERITKDEINFEDKGIELPASKIKTGKRIYVSGFPDTLWKWLKITPEACWSMKSKQIMHEKTKAFIRAGIRHPKNCLRHGFCTYHLGAFGDIGKSMTLSCHSSIGIFNEHYRGICTVADAKKFWEILP